MEQYVKEQIKYGLKYVPANLIKSVFVKKSSEETESFRNREFICGICHAHEEYDLLHEANIKWIRTDVPFPFNPDGTLSDRFIYYKEMVKRYSDNGIKAMAVTPYPQEYLNYGADIRTPDGEKKVVEITKFIFDELKDYVGGIQITNEMGMPRFTIPFTMDEAAKFIGVQLESLYENRGNILIGYNCAGPAADLHVRMRPYLKYCDYVGVDIYIGCFGAFIQPMWLYDVILNYLWAMTKKPILIQEFGYISGGYPKTKEEKKQILKKYGAESEKDAKTKMDVFVENMPDYFSDHIKHLAHNDSSRYYDLIFKSDLKDHFYCELPAIQKIPFCDHTPEGQKRFYDKIFKRIFKKKFVCGAIVYMFDDTHKCYVCGQSDCPIETKWGIVDRQKTPKPAYYSVKKAFGEIQGK